MKELLSTIGVWLLGAVMVVAYIVFWIFMAVFPIVLALLFLLWLIS